MTNLTKHKVEYKLEGNLVISDDIAKMSYSRYVPCTVVSGKVVIDLSLGNYFILNLDIIPDVFSIKTIEFSILNKDIYKRFTILVRKPKYKFVNFIWDAEDYTVIFPWGDPKGTFQLTDRQSIISLFKFKEELEIPYYIADATPWFIII